MRGGRNANLRTETKYLLRISAESTIPAVWHLMSFFTDYAVFLTLFKKRGGGQTHVKRYTDFVKAY